MCNNALGFHFCHPLRTQRAAAEIKSPENIGVRSLETSHSDFAQQMTSHSGSLSLLKCIGWLLFAHDLLVFIAPGSLCLGYCLLLGCGQQLLP